MNHKKKAKTMTFIGFIIGYSLIGNLSAYEQNALGNFFMEIAQVLETNSAIEQALNPNNQANCIDEINLIKNAINKINSELNKYH